MTRRSNAPRRRFGRLRWFLGIGAVLSAAVVALAFFSAPRSTDVTVSETPRDVVSVRLTEVQEGAVTQWLFAEGVAQAVRKDFLQFERPGRVAYIATDAQGRPLREGSRVNGPAQGERFGQLIAQLDDRESAAQVAQTDAQVAAAGRRVESARAALEQARQEFERQSRLAERGLTPQAERERAEAAFLSAEAQLREAEAEVRALSAQADEAKIGLERTSLFAPYDGVISLMNIREGDYATGVAPNTEGSALEAGAAVVVIDDSLFEITLHLPPHEALLVREGQTAYVGLTGEAVASTIRNEQGGSPALRGEVWSVSPSISLQRRAVVVKVRVEGAEGILRDGAFVSVWIAAAQASDTNLIPYSALIPRAAETFVFVYDPETGLVGRREIEPGLLGLDHVQVLSGLAAGELVVAEGHHRLTDGARARPVDPSVVEVAQPQASLAAEDGGAEP